MKRELFESFCEIAYTQAGIKLRAGKEMLVASRVARRLRALGLTNEDEYLAQLRADRSGLELVHFLNDISTNFTSFFREPDHFQVLAEAARAAVGSGQGEFKVWSAASSTGEEPYTVAMVLRDAFQGTALQPRILATDISTRALAVASAGEYGRDHVDRVPQPFRGNAFERLENPGAEPRYRVRPELRRLITFARLNLAQPPFPMRGPFDVVLVRNVMIYFDTAVRQRLVSSIAPLLRPGGLLITGHSETLNGVETELELVRPSVYRRREHA